MTALHRARQDGEVSDGVCSRALIGMAIGIVVLQGTLFLAFGPWRAEVVALYSRLGVDSREYEELALCILEVHSLCDSSLRTPGYPLFIAAVYAVFGQKPWIVLLAQIGVAIATAGMVYAIGSLVHSKRVGLIAAALWAFDPVSLLAPSMLMAEGLFVLVLLCGLHCYLRGLWRGQLLWALAAGLLLGASTLVRPVGQYYSVILMIAALFWSARTMVWRTGFTTALLLSFLLALAPWLYRNHSRFESFSLTTVPGVTLLEWQVAEYLSQRDDIPFASVQKQLRAEASLLGYDPEGNPFRNAAVEQHLAMQYIWRDPGGFALATMKGVAFMFVNMSSTALLERLAPNDDGPPTKARTDQAPVAEPDRVPVRAGKIVVALVMLPMFVIQWALFGFGARRLWRDRERFLLGLALVSIAYFALTAGANGITRFRIPMQPLFLLVGAVGASNLLGARTLSSGIARRDLTRVSAR